MAKYLAYAECLGMKFHYRNSSIRDPIPMTSGIDSGGAGVARAPREFGGSEKGQSLISAILAITASISALDLKSYLRRCFVLYAVVLINEVYILS